MANKTMMCQILSYVASNLILKSQYSKFDIRKSINPTQFKKYCKHIISFLEMFQFQMTLHGSETREGNP